MIRSSFRSFLIISKSDRHHFGFAIQSEFEHSTADAASNSCVTVVTASTAATQASWTHGYT